jgi:hypothetical protein
MKAGIARLKQHSIVGTDRDEVIDHTWLGGTNASGAEILLEPLDLSQGVGSMSRSPALPQCGAFLSEAGGL